MALVMPAEQLRFLSAQYQFISGDSGNSAQILYLLFSERRTSFQTSPRLFIITSGGTLAITHELSLSSFFSWPFSHPEYPRKNLTWSRPTVPVAMRLRSASIAPPHHIPGTTGTLPGTFVPRVCR